MSNRLLPFGVMFVTIFARAETPQPPVSPDGSVKVTLFAAESQVVTPIGATVDSHGRLLIIESHTHFRPKDYVGPKTDRIRILEDSTGSGIADKFTTFYEGTNWMMNLVAEPDGSVLVSSRNEIFRLIPETEGPPRKVTIAHLETKSDYPHNGLHGLATDALHNIYFSLGENFGGAYVLVGADGKKYGDDKGSGAVFRVDAQGGGLTLICHGFWNPFGLHVSPDGQVWCVDNDPDGRPPCRLIQVVPGGDYGYEWRYGRTGLHPLQGWDGELPGTLGMVAGVGEAPCAVRWYRGKMLVSSWRDHVLQAFELSPRGASYSASVSDIVTGGENFRPVGIAPAPDGSLFVTDWGSSSYNVNGKGRVWKLTFAQPESHVELPKNKAGQVAEALRKSTDVAQLLTAMDDPDSYVAQAAQFGLSQQPESEKLDWSALKSSRQRIGFLAALIWRGTDTTPFISAALSDPDDRVKQMGVRCVTEQNLKDARGDLEHMLESGTLSPRLLGMTLATLSQLNGDKTAKIDPVKINAVLMARMNAPQASDEAKSAAMHMMLATHPKILLEQVAAMLKSPTISLQLEAVRYLSDDQQPGRFDLLAQAATDVKNDASVRAEAAAGLADDAAARADLLMQLAAGADAAPREEALRSLRPLVAKLTAAQKDQLAQVARQYPTDADLVSRALGQPVPPHPAETDIAAWQKIIDQTPGDPVAGRRIFFHAAGAGCFRCHTIEGRGRSIGPDLTKIGHSQTREHVLESILDPSREIAPLFTLWTITKKNGDKVDGMLLRRDGQSNEVYVDSAGKETTVKEGDVADRKMRKESLMPTGLVQGMTDQELRDVVAYVTEKR